MIERPLVDQVSEEEKDRPLFVTANWEPVATVTSDSINLSEMLPACYSPGIFLS